ncbi:MAG TPA: family 10 glycosylhydrolase [Candidatus Monoglobus merdigallinarum]|uniref:Family 10 glycosylhydrolase n=1 Tax=Candidatus Monoglobus merdigallinarum TaxID=2838698 RepID=A0A9D1TLP8_9FIRM|nr:family 10 glycosylhydrolase [Candidatus Monoglobus merdigallinarum]
MKKYEFSMRLIVFAVCAVIAVNLFYIPESGMVEAEETEMRAVWVATVANLDYPAQATTDAWQLRVQLDEVLNNCEDMGFNTIFLQVRPSGDALYNSSVYPWSRYLTGTQGVAPSDGFDPLEYAVTEAHKRGIQLHAWINPYRVTNSSADNDRLAANNPAVLRPDLVLTDSTGKMYLNPGEADSIEIILEGIREIVRNYDVDGIHMDDYFYPSSGFDDSASYYKYQDQYPNKADWRRSMVNTLISCAYSAIKEIDPSCMFGVSPSGIWANASDTPGGSDTNGNSSYHSLYADTKYWVESGFLDYIMPQIYWYIGQSGSDYNTLINWWAGVCAPTNVKLYIGEAAYKAASGSDAAWRGQNGVNELRTHVEMGRQSQYIDGYSMYAYSSFMNNSSLYNLIKELNQTPASAPTLGGGETAQPTQSPADEPEAVPTEAPQPTQAPSSSSGSASRFTDMAEYDWAMPYIDALVADGIVNGISETQFGPDIYVSRADATALLYRTLKEVDIEFTDNFTDVTPDKYYYDEIGQAKAAGVAWGVGGNLFNPDGTLLRQDMATLAYRVLRGRQIVSSIPNTAKALNNYSDWSDIDFYARDAIASCVENNLMGGYGDGTIRPKDFATRIEVALFVYRIGELLDAQ